jgi:hypothetical protein
MVNPANGQHVTLSASAQTGYGHTLANTRAAFRRAGLDLDVSRRSGRPRGIPATTPIPEEVPTMATDPTGVDAGLARNTQTLHQAGRSAGGAFALKAPKQPHAIAGHRVLIGERMDGKWVAEMRDDSTRSKRRQWMSEAEDTLVARITRDLEEGRTPTVRGPRHTEHPGRSQAAGAEAEPPASAPTLPPFVAERVHEQAQARANGSAGTASWRAVGVDQAEFPLAAALDHLQASVAPALEALEAAGKVDAAALIRAEVATTPVEAELLRLWRRVTTGD